MKQVVQEVLNKNTTIVSNKSNRPMTNPVNERGSTLGLQHIKRPNYQQLKKDERLSIITNKRSNKPTYHQQSNRGNAISDKKRTNSSILPERFNRESVSKLSSLTLAQGNTSARGNTVRSRGGQSTDKGKLIGKTKNNGYVWFFPNVQNELRGNFNRSLNNTSIGVIQMPECLPSYLLLINDVVRNNQQIEFYISWDGEGKKPFVAELYNSDPSKLKTIMNELFEKINRRSLKQSEVYIAPSPSSWLSKQLNINSPVDSIAFLEGVPYYSSILLIDKRLKDNPNCNVDFEITKNYLLLKGNEQTITKLITEMKREADRL